MSQLALIPNDLPPRDHHHTDEPEDTQSLCLNLLQVEGERHHDNYCVEGVEGVGYQVHGVGCEGFQNDLHRKYHQKDRIQLDHNRLLDNILAQTSQPEQYKYRVENNNDQRDTLHQLVLQHLQTHAFELRHGVFLLLHGYFVIGACDLRHEVFFVLFEVTETAHYYEVDAGEHEY